MLAWPAKRGSSMPESGKPQQRLSLRPIEIPGLGSAKSDWDRAEQINADLYRDLKKVVSDQLERVFDYRYCDIEPDFPGFVHIYHDLAQQIPADTTVLDLGCAYAAQGWYFRHHKAYIGVDFVDTKARFCFPNTQHIVSNIKTFLDEVEAGTRTIPGPVFAIMSYVPVLQDVEERVQKLFPDHFVYYPRSAPSMIRLHPRPARPEMDDPLSGPSP